MSKYDELKLPCGGTASMSKHDEFKLPYGGTASMCSYICTTCFATIGSIGQSSECKDMAAMYENWETLGGQGWNYITGQPNQNLDGTEYEFNQHDYPTEVK